MENVQRIEGIKYHLDKQTDEELANIRNNLLVTHARVTGEIALLETVLFERANPQLPLEQ